MSATGNEVVTLKQLKIAMDSVGGGIPLKTMTNSDNLDNLKDFNDAGIYYRASGGSIAGAPASISSTPFVLEVLPIYNIGGYWIMLQRATSYAGSMFIRGIQSGGTWGNWESVN